MTMSWRNVLLRTSDKLCLQKVKMVISCKMTSLPRPTSIHLMMTTKMKTKQTVSRKRSRMMEWRLNLIMMIP